MTWSVYQHWDPLEVCIVGRSYPPEFYSWIEIPHVRELFERIAIETEEDYQAVINTLKSFNVEVLRPELPNITFDGEKHIPPPMFPRDHMIMVGDKFYENYSFDLGYNKDIEESYNKIKDQSWPACSSYQEFTQLPQWIQDECINIHQFGKFLPTTCYNKIFDRIASNGNTVVSNFFNPKLINGAMISRVGRDLYFGTEMYNQKVPKHIIDSEFTNTRNYIVDTGGHGDGTYCPVAPGLIISLQDVPCYKDTFPGWEVVYLPGQYWNDMKPFLDLKEKNKGKWWIPGFEYDQSVIDVVESWLGHWTGYVEETVFDVNMLIVDPKNVIVFNYNKLVFDALERYGITPHIVPFRHRYFWDGGIHCITTDLSRRGTMQDYFPERG